MSIATMGHGDEAWHIYIYIDIYIYMDVVSKMEYTLLQMFCNSRNSFSYKCGGA